MEIDLSNRTAIVTGGGRGIGKEIALRLADAGADVAVAARTDEEIRRTAEAIEASGGRAIAVPTDLRDPDDLDRLIATTSEELGAADVLVNNAAVHVAGDPLDRTVEDVDAMLDVNLRGVFLLSQRFAREFRESDAEDGHIVNVSSIVGHLSVPAMTVYCGTKSGVYGLTRGLAGELGPDGITVNSVSPGLTRVDRIERLLEEHAELYDVDTIPLGRLAEPADIANACLFLVSDLAAYVTGVDLPVDGGAVTTAALYREQYVG